MHLVQLLLPVHDNSGRSFPPNYFNQVREDLTDRFGGVTAFIRAPAVGLWRESVDETNREEVVMFEVLADKLDKDWWASYRQQLEERFRQDKILIWASTIARL